MRFYCQIVYQNDCEQHLTLGFSFKFIIASFLKKIMIKTYEHLCFTLKETMEKSVWLVSKYVYATCNY